MRREENSHEDVVGSLILCLPSKFKGGELQISPRSLGRISHTFNFAKKSGDHSVVQWAAFPADCDAKSSPVTSGARVTVTYNLVQESRHVMEISHRGNTGKKSMFCGPSNEHVVEQLVTYLEELPKNMKKIGIFLTRKYSLHELSLARLPVQGLDKDLIRAFEQNKWRFRIIPVLAQVSVTQYEEELNSTDSSIYAFAEDDWRRMSNAKKSKTSRKTNVSGIPFFASQQMGQCLYTELQGQESQTHSFLYYHCAVILERRKA